MAPSVSTPSTAPFSPRLNGWKEIAAHFGKGVRTVQRWEKELGLPVRRITTGRGEIVYASTAELEAWRIAAEKHDDFGPRAGEDDTPASGVESVPASASQVPAPPTPADPPPSPVGTRLRRAGLAVAGVVAIAAAAAAVTSITRGARVPADVRVENHVLRVYDDRGAFLWEHAFDFPLSDDPAALETRRRYPSTVVDDIDGDGSREVVVATNADAVPGSGLFCFEANGTLRFAHRLQPHVSFGNVPSAGPWFPLVMTIAGDGEKQKSIWLSSVDYNQFPTVVQKVDPRGRVVGEFWHPGNLLTLVPTTLAGRDVMVLTGASNEFFGAAVAIVDRRNPTGTGPALRDKYRCQGCPASGPLEYLVFPGTELERLQELSSGPVWVDRGTRGEFKFVVSHHFAFNLFARGSDLGWGDTHYLFGPDLRPLTAQHQPGYRVLHDEAHRRGILDHAYGPADEANVWPVLRWDGHAFEEVRPR